MSDFGTFFLPGPTEVRREILEAMLQPMLPHRGKAFEELYGRVDTGLRTVFRTQRPVYIGSCSATGLMEAAVRCSPPGPVLALVNGAFSQRFADIARACDRETRVLQVPLGATHALDAVDAALAEQWHAAMTVVHSETSTGALQDIAALAALAQKHGTAILVDSVTGIGGAPVETDAWQLDFVLTGSQKALALPPGLAFGVASESFILQAQTATAKGLYFDLVEFEEYAHKRQTPNTPALSLIYAADAQMRAIAAEGIEARWARHEAMRLEVLAWTERMGLGVVAAEGQRSPTVTAITLPSGITGPAMAAAVAKLGYVIGSGYGGLKETTFRVGHMGDHSLHGLRGCLGACEAALDSLRAH